MADFKFLGDPNAFGGKVLKIRCQHKDGTSPDHDPPSGHTEWLVNDVISVTDSRAIRQLQNDPRFEQI